MLLILFFKQWIMEYPVAGTLLIFFVFIYKSGYYGSGCVKLKEGVKVNK
jgi:hypothetical protein